LQGNLRVLEFVRVDGLIEDRTGTGTAGDSFSAVAQMDPTVSISLVAPELNPGGAATPVACLLAVLCVVLERRVRSAGRR
jgi:hypothetical protein